VTNYFIRAGSYNISRTAKATGFKFRILVSRVIFSFVMPDFDYLPSGRGQGHVTNFYIFGAQAISLDGMRLDISNLVCRLNVKSTGITHVNVLQHGVHLRSRDLKILGNKC